MLYFKSNDEVWRVSKPEQNNRYKGEGIVIWRDFLVRQSYGVLSTESTWQGLISPPQYSSMNYKPIGIIIISLVEAVIGYGTRPGGLRGMASKPQHLRIFEHRNAQMKNLPTNLF